MRQLRSKVPAYVVLARVSNLPTVWTNVLAGMVLTGRNVDSGRWVMLACGVSLLYCAGMVLNDVSDAKHDARARPDRPIPAGHITPAAARNFALVLGLGGIGVITAASATSSVGAPLAMTLLLVTAIVYYDLRHKQDSAGPFVMGICRGLVYCVAGTAVSGHLPRPLLIGATIMAVYVSALTLVAKYGNPRYGWSIGWLIAGICIVDAASIAYAGHVQLAVYALLGFALTIAAQRVVSGT
jgi:4-hydroxybenzoate polyprenyltransferase